MTRVTTFESQAIQRKTLVALSVDEHVVCRITHLPAALAVRVARCKHPTAGELRILRVDECTKEQQQEAVKRSIYGQREAALLIESGRLPIAAEDPLADVAEALRRRFAKARSVDAGGGQ